MTCPTRSGWVGNLSPWACEQSEHIDKGAMVWGDGGQTLTRWRTLPIWAGPSPTEPGFNWRGFPSC